MTNPISQGSAPIADELQGPRPCPNSEHPRRAGGLRANGVPEVSHPSRGADQARAAQSSKLPTARASTLKAETMTRDPISLARTIAVTALQHRCARFTAAGGRLQGPEDPAWCWEEAQWIARYGDITGTGPSRIAAIADWLSRATVGISTRATDGQLDCPFNDQPQSPWPPSPRAMPSL